MSFGKRELVTVVEPAAFAEVSSARDVGLGHVHAMGFVTGLGEPGDHLADATTHVERARAGLRGSPGVGVLGVETRVPVGEKFGVRLVLLVSLLVAPSVPGAR